MDKQIKKIERDVSKISKSHKHKHDEKKMQKNLGHVGKELKHLEKIDKKHDKLIDKARKINKKR